MSLYARSSDDKDGFIYIKSNDRILCETYINEAADHRESVSWTVVAELTAGDTVRVSGSSTYPVRIAASLSGFTGHLVQSYA